MNKRGQFFILAAVILIATLVTLSTTVNYATVNKEPGKFYDLSYEIKQEGGEVINYGVYQNESEIKSIIENYTTDVGSYLGDSDPETEIFFIYGNRSGLIIENYAKQDTIISTPETSEYSTACGADLKTSASLQIGNQTFTRGVISKSSAYYGSCKTTLNFASQTKNLQVRIGNQSYQFSLEENQQFLILARKAVGNETYVDLR
jgi:hypothetical protein